MGGHSMVMVQERLQFTEVDERGHSTSRRPNVADAYRADCECGRSSGPQLVRAQAVQWWVTHEYDERKD